MDEYSSDDSFGLDFEKQEKKQEERRKEELKQQ